jgi:hypothetical protein
MQVDVSERDFFHTHNEMFPHHPPPPPTTTGRRGTSYRGIGGGGLQKEYYVHKVLGAGGGKN